MIITDTPKKKHEIFTYSEFVSQATSRKQSKKHDHRSSGKKDFKFSQSESLKHAVQMATEGWDAGIKQLELEGGLAIQGNTNWEAAVVGSTVNLGNYLNGLPDNMWQFTDNREYNLPELEIKVRLDYSFGNSGKKAMKFCKSIITLVNKYQATHNVKLVGIFDVKQDKVDYIIEVIIKEFNERFVLNNIAFAFHPAFFRRLWFRLGECEPFLSWGYGSVQGRSPKARKGVKTIVIPKLDDISEGDFTDEDITKYNF